MYHLQYLLGKIKELCNGSFITINVPTGQSQLDEAFGVFREAKDKANKAIIALSEESSKVQNEIQELTKEYKEALELKEQKEKDIKTSTDSAMNFITKINGIIE